VPANFQTLIESKAVEPCPVCATTDKLRLIISDALPNWRRYFIRCDCGLESSPRHTLELAVAAWNVGAIHPPTRTIGCQCTAPDNPMTPRTKPTREPAFKFPSLAGHHTGRSDDRS
jgi:hypothetical protein